MAVPRSRLVLLAAGGIGLLGGLTGALVLLGIALPTSMGRLGAGHGLLMTLGFLGTLIALERAVALGAGWGYLAPLAAGAGGLSVVAGLPGSVTAVLFALAGVGYVGLYVAFERIERSLHTTVQAVGAVAWLVAALLLVGGSPVARVVPWLAAFLVLTIAGERLELSRLGRPSRSARWTFVVAATIFVGGVALSTADATTGGRLAGVGLVAIAAWLARHDIARRTVRGTGVTRFVAVALLSGYAWLAVAGLGWLAFGGDVVGPRRDAILHALFLGFVMSMVFGHAPIILPAVLRTPLPYHARFYLHLALLHAGLVLRIVVGDVAGERGAWQLGGILNVVALLLFVASSAASAAAAAMERRAGAGMHRGRRTAAPSDTSAVIGR